MKYRVSPPAAAGKLTSRRSPHALLRSLILTFLVSLLPLSIASPALAELGFQPGEVGFDVTATNPDGTPDLQAGSHPYEFTTSFNFETTLNANGETVPDGALKDLAVELPPGLVGNATAVPQCSQRLFYASPSHQGSLDSTDCPVSTVVGVERLRLTEEAGFEAVNIYNLVPAQGVPAEFGFDYADVPVLLTPSVRTGRDYGLTVESRNTSQGVTVYGASTTFWGVPGDHRHDAERGPDCLTIDGPNGELCPAGAAVVPLLTMPSSCGAPLTYAIEADSWQEPEGWAHATVQSEDTTGQPVTLKGCNKLPFSPSLQILPDGSAGSTPTGLNVNLRVPQEEDLNPAGLSEGDVQNTTVALPEGVVLNPAAADGLQACSEAQAGYEGFEAQSETELFSPGAVSCPEASKVATVQIKTPLLPEELEGAVYLAAQEANPFGSLVALYLVAEDPVAGVRIKLAGQVTLDQATGRLVTTFKNTPQLPFEELKLQFFGTDRAPLATPARCGTYSSEASLAPWSGVPVATLPAQFDITSGPGGGGCFDPLPFAPSLTAGSTSVQAGGFSPFTMTMSREDGQQSLSAVALDMPAGLSGVLSGVKLCGEAQADAGTCGPESEIGETTVSVGLGGDPYTVTGGRVYLTGPTEGAPFGLSIVNPAKAGPFDLESTRESHPACDCLVVRAKIEVDPHTAALRITSDPSGPYSIPRILDGIPLQIKHVNVTIDRPNFTFNPTDCNKLAITGTLSSTEGASAALQVPFQVTNCAALKFEPKFAVSTSGKTSKANGAGLSVKLTYPKAPFGSQANIARVKVDLPKQLPSRLTTLQKACTAATFEANPANCPAASVVGHATAVTPILPVALEGPAYFVSHGGEAFPSLIVVLQGYGVTVDLVGTTFISKQGITSSTFQQVPDVPVGSFELTLPTGRYSALAANLPAKDKGSFCGQSLAMPTAFVAQNGAEIHESTKITVTSCPKAKKLKKAKKTKRNAKAKHSAKKK